MINALNDVNKKYRQDMKIRIGVHSGDVNAGIIGAVKFLFGKHHNVISTTYILV